MLSLPSKQWKKIKLTPVEGRQYKIVFLSPIRSEQEFSRIVGEDLPGCLAGPGAVIGSAWESRSVEVVVDDMAFFRQRLVFRNIIIEED
jgi:hypothetical protein